jgi:sulfate adenylyltransferase subunit 1
MVEGLDADVPYTVVPVSSLKGDNVVKSTEKMSWYTGKTLNGLLHETEADISESQPLRFDVQHVIHSQENGFVDYRGYAGRVISGTVAVGDTLRVLPSNKESVVTEVRRYAESKEKAISGDSVSISLADELDISRGAILVHPETAVEPQQTVKATVVWMDDKVAHVGSKWLLKVASREFPVKLQSIFQSVDPTKKNAQESTDSIALNDITEVEIRLSQPGYFDAYAKNKKNGIFILIDPQSNNTVAIGFIQ